MRIVQIEQGTPEWLGWRDGGIGGSDLPVICDVSPHTTRYQLWMRKLGFAPEQAEKFILRKGKEEEPKARAWAREKLGERIFPVCVEGEKSHYRVSLDGISALGDDVHEIKLVGREDFERAKAGKVPARHTPQLAYQAEVAEAERVIYIPWCEGEGLILPITREVLARQVDSLAKADAFWQLVIDMTEPELCDRDVVERTDEEWLAEVAKLKDADLRLLAAKAEYEAAEAALKGMLTHPRCIGGGVSITRFPKRGNVDYKLVPQLAGVDLNAYRKPTTTEVRMTKEWTPRKARK
jgi:putative phage-type endonuclease